MYGGHRITTFLALTILGFACGVAWDGISPSRLQAQEASKPTTTDDPVKQIQAAGGLVLEIASDDARLEVSFHLADDKIEDDHVIPVTKLKNVVRLNLRGTEVGDAGVATLSKIKTLEKLHLEKTKVTDKGLVHLKQLKKLQYLNLYGTQVTDAGLTSVAEIESLSRVYLWQTKVTDEGVKKLQDARPKLKIIRGVSLAPPPADPKKDAAKK